MPRRRPLPPAIGLLGALLLHAAACAGPAPGPAAPDPDAADHRVCAARASGPDGACCPDGQLWLPAAGACAAVGPPECASLVAAAPEACVPRWCPAGRDDAGYACDPAAPGCHLTGAACPGDDAPAAAGCPAGSWPDGAGACRPAGIAAAGGAIPTPRWCDDAWWRWPEGRCTPGELRCARHGRPCTPAETAALAGCPAGWWPDPARDGACTPAGWPSSLPLPVVAPGELPPLPPLVDPRWCWRWRDAAGGACQPGLAGCDLQERACTAAEAAACVPSAPLGGAAVGCSLSGVGWTCPPGFQAEADTGGAVACEPLPGACAAGAALPSGVHLYVDPHAAPGGDGSAGKPFATVQAAVAAAPSGAVLVLAPGTHPGPVLVDRPLTLAGRCAARSVLAGPPGAPTLRVAGAANGDVVVQDLALVGPEPGLQVEAGWRVHGRRLHVRAPTGAVVGAGSLLVLQDAVVVPGPAGAGSGIVVRRGARADLRRVRVAGQRGLGIELQRDAELHAVELRVDATRPAGDGARFGEGVVLAAGARARLAAVLVADARRRGLALLGAEDEAVAMIDVDAAGLRIEGVTEAQGAPWQVQALRVEEGAALRCLGCRLTANRGTGLLLQGWRGQVQATDLLVDGTLGRESDGSAGEAIAAEKGRLELHGGRLHGNTRAGVVQQADSHVFARGLLVDGTRVQGGDNPGYLPLYGAVGMLGLGAPRLVLDGCRIHGNAGAGIEHQAGGDVSTVLRVAGTLIDGQEPDREGKGGEAIVLSGNLGQVELLATRLSGNRTDGLRAEHAPQPHLVPILVARELVVDGTLPDGHGDGGVGISLADGARLDGRGLLLAGNRSTGLHLRSGARGWLAGLRFDGTVEGDWTQVAALADTQARLWLAGAAVSRSRMTGLAALLGGRVTAVGCDLRDGEPGLDSEYGAGAIAAFSGELVLRSSRAQANALAAVVVWQSSAAVEGSVLVASRPSRWVDEHGRPVEFADGLLAIAAKRLGLTASVATGHPRAGVLLSGCGDATVIGNVLAGNGFGLVNDGCPGLQAAGNAAWTNSQADFQLDGGLQVPAAPESVLGLATAP